MSPPSWVTSRTCSVPMYAGLEQEFDTGDQLLAVKSVGTGVGIVLADLVSVRCLATIARHGHHSTAAREHDAAYRRAAIGSGLRLTARVECFGAHKAPGANDADH